MVNRVLLTGFGDWSGSTANPSRAVAEALDGTTIAGAGLRAVIAPSIFEEMVGVVTREIERFSPDCVIMLDEFCRRTMITVERLAQNLIDATRYAMGDATGARPQDQPVVPGGPVAYRSTLPMRAMVRAMRQQGFPSDISDTAGTFGCNLLMYGVLHNIARHRLPIRAGWIHLPSLPVTAALETYLGMPSMALDTQIGGLRVAVEAAVENGTDIEEPIRSLWQ